MSSINYNPSESAYANGQPLQSAAASATTSATAANKPNDADLKAEKNDDDDLSFADFIDVINPLQHIPIVSSIYRAITNDEISPVARFIGDSLYMGPIGAATAMVNIAVEELTGEDIGENVASLFDSGGPGNDPNGETLEIEAIIAEHFIEQDEIAQQAMLAQGNTVQTASLSQNSGGTPLDPRAAFSFNQPTIANPAPGPALNAGFADDYMSSFNQSTQPVALESLPADILAALYSGSPLSPSGSIPGSFPGNISPDTTNAISAYSPGSIETPRWNLWQQDDPTQLSSIASPVEMVPQALFPRAMGNYQNTNNLSNPAGQFVNVVE